MKKISNEEPRVTVGCILGAHGVKGCLRLHPLTDYPDRFYSMKELSLTFPNKPPVSLTVTDISFHEGKYQFLVKTKEIDDMDSADALKGAIVTIPSSQRAALARDEYWHDDLVGLQVEDISSGELLGVLEEIISTGSNDVYSVRTPEGALKMLPAIKQVVSEVDLDAHVMRVTLLEGLWD